MHSTKQQLTQAFAGLEQIEAKTTSIDKYMYLANLRNSNVDLFYRLLIDNMPVSCSFIDPLISYLVLLELLEELAYLHMDVGNFWVNMGKAISERR
jgi:hypothetical protein